MASLITWNFVTPYDQALGVTTQHPAEIAKMWNDELIANGACSAVNSSYTVSTSGSYFELSVGSTGHRLMIVAGGGGIPTTNMFSQDTENANHVYVAMATGVTGNGDPNTAGIWTTATSKTVFSSCYLATNALPGKFFIIHSPEGFIACPFGANHRGTIMCGNLLVDGSGTEQPILCCGQGTIAGEWLANDAGGNFLDTDASDSAIVPQMQQPVADPQAEATRTSTKLHRINQVRGYTSVFQPIVVARLTTAAAGNDGDIIGTLRQIKMYGLESNDVGTKVASSDNSLILSYTYVPRSGSDVQTLEFTTTL